MVLGLARQQWLTPDTQGEAILRVWLHDHTHIDDYIQVRIGFAVTPNMATVHLGTRNPPCTLPTIVTYSCLEMMFLIIPILIVGSGRH